MNEVTYFKCKHKTIWGQISRLGKTRNPNNHPMYCRDCGEFKGVIKTVKEKS